MCAPFFIETMEVAYCQKKNITFLNSVKKSSLYLKSSGTSESSVEYLCCGNSVVDSQSVRGSGTLEFYGVSMFYGNNVSVEVNDSNCGGIINNFYLPNMTVTG